MNRKQKWVLVVGLGMVGLYLLQDRLFTGYGTFNFVLGVACSAGAAFLAFGGQAKAE